MMTSCPTVILPLHTACKEGDLSAVQQLIDNGVDINEKDERTWTPLHYASAYGQYYIVKLLVEKGADVNATDKSGKIPLAYVFLNGHITIAVVVNERGANVGISDIGREPGSMDDFICIALKLIIKGSNLDWIEDIGADANSEIYPGYTLLQHACNSNYVSIARLLIAKGGNVYQAMHYALFRNHTECVQLLVEHGVDVNATFEDGHSLLYITCERIIHPDKCTWHGKELHGHDNLKLAKFLIKSGVDVELAGNDGCTPLVHAVKHESSEVCEILTEAASENGLVWRYE